MFIPYHVDVPFNHRPVMNYLVVLFVIVIFILQIASNSDPTMSQSFKGFILDGWGIKGLFGYMWLHAGILHLIGNLLFLWLFGNAVCSKIGNILYLPTYIGLGLIAAASHLIFNGHPAVGASGAINGIVGMYLVFFPENDIDCFFWFFRFFFFSVSGFWMILLWFVFDLIGAFRGSTGVAYFAHIGGFLGGFGLAILMLEKKWIVMERDEGSILDLLRPKKRTSFRINVTNTHYEKTEYKYPCPEKIESKKFVEEDKKINDTFIHLRCQCGQKIKIDRNFAGKIGRCPKCKNILTIPRLEN
jgi:membrane associated rhomboid family serine protease